MPKALLTTMSSVDEIPYSESGQPIYWCTDLSGFGVRTGAREKTFIVGRWVNRKFKVVKIGRVGEITLQKARKDAALLIGEMVGGIDPVARKRQQTADCITLREAWELQQQAMQSKNGSSKTKRDYQGKIDCHMSDWLDRPLVAITRQLARERHIEIGENHGTYQANGVMRVLRAIWNRVRRQFPDLPESPTRNVDFYPEHGRTAVITNWRAWWSGVQQIENPVRRDLYIWLAFSGCRSGECMSMEVNNIDLKRGVMRFPVTKTGAFEMPLSDFQIELLQSRIAQNAEEFGADCPWVFPSATSKSGHIEEPKLNGDEPELFIEQWSAHTLRHSWITSDQKIRLPESHQRALTNHKPKRARNGDAHAGYIHPDLDDLRESQQRITDYLLTQIAPPGNGKKRDDNVVRLRREVA
jgi:integrase